MNKTKLVLFLLIFTSTLFSQEWYKHINAQSNLMDKLAKGERWDSILIHAKEDLIIDRKYLHDINETISFRKSTAIVTEIDSFFLNICDSVFAEFPYRRSGHLEKRLYLKHEQDTSEFGKIVRTITRESLYPKFSNVVLAPKEKSLPQLIQYLKNDASTRLIVRPMDYDEAPYYLSISDVALELIEVITYCDFYDNASHSEKLFSNLESQEKDSLIHIIENWCGKSLQLSQFEAVEYFIDSICGPGYSYLYTCNNLLFAGDTIRAKSMYQKYYDRTDLPCRINHSVGRTLLELGDRRIIEDCFNKSINYRCMDSNGKGCIDILLHSDSAHSRDNLLAEIVSTEPQSNFRKKGTGPGYIWYKIFDELANYDKYKMPLTLIALMKIAKPLTSIQDYHYDKWRDLYPSQIENGFRICDLALLKYHETISELTIEDWLDIKERNKQIAELIK